jgi:hypothetical protein
MEYKQKLAQSCCGCAFDDAGSTPFGLSYMHVPDPVQVGSSPWIAQGSECIVLGQKLGQESIKEKNSRALILPLAPKN